MIKGQLRLKAQLCQEISTLVKLELTGFYRGDLMDKYDKYRLKEEAAKKPAKKKEVKKEEPKKTTSKLAE